MTYYRIMQYCIANGMPAAKADYMRKLVRRLVQQKEAEAAHIPLTDGEHLTVATIRECHRQLKVVDRPLAEVVKYRDFRTLTEMLKERHQIDCVPCAEGNEPFNGYHYGLNGTADKCTRKESRS